MFGKKIIFLTIFLSFLAFTSTLVPESLGVYSYQLKSQTISYLRKLEPMVRNFGTKPTTPPKDQDDKYYINVAKAYKKAQTSYIIALAYYYEKNYVEALTEFKKCQVQIEKIMERLSQFYVDRTREIVRAAIGDLHPNPEKDKDKKGISVMDINIKLGGNSQKAKYFRVNRRAPMESRFYSPKEIHLSRNLQTIESNLIQAYKNIGNAVAARNKAVFIEHTLETHQKLRPLHRRQRIEWYFTAIECTKKAKRQAINIFVLKYPHENLPHQSDKLADNKTDFNFTDNALYVPKKMHPIYDERIPAKYQRDAADALGFVYDDEYKHKILGAQWKDGEWMQCDAKGENCKKVN
jgi:tetratricopeptide (TPR) repeat protein